MSSCLLIDVINDPGCSSSLSGAQWTMVIGQARRTNLLARLAYRLETVWESVPESVAIHLQSERMLAAKHCRDIENELRYIEEAVGGVLGPFVILKGAAYVALHEPQSKGRIFSDVDVLVPKAALTQVEHALKMNGWAHGNISSYDEHYYRQWTHEIPPLTNVLRQTGLDLHHNILPIKSNYCPDVELLLEDIIPIEGSALSVLSISDRIIHSALHLVFEGEPENGLRDLLDIETMLNDLDVEEGDWGRLLQRAQQLRVEAPFHSVLRMCLMLFKPDIPDAVKESLQQVGRSGWHWRLMDQAMLRALMPDIDICCDRWTGLSRSLVYLRGHYNTLPPRLLLPHLLYKSYLSFVGSDVK